ncbi:transmembrane 9 superfamily member 2 [Citrus sinensis]|nr:transmembrane 9 superfamily member 2 [Citrus sinensis]
MYLRILKFKDSIIKEKNEALGEVLNGDRLVSAPYKLNFRDDKESAVVCRKKLSKEEVVQFRNAVEKDYYFQMYAQDEEAADDQKVTGWKYIHGDVFRFPKYKSLFAAALGYGTQLFTLATAALPFGTIVVIVLIWTLVTSPLLVLGGIAGKKHVWGHMMYTIYNILFIVFIILLIVTTFITVALTYFQFAAEDHEWWWRPHSSLGTWLVFAMASFLCLGRLVSEPLCYLSDIYTDRSSVSSGLFKLNCDATVNVQYGMVSYGTVICNRESLLMLAGIDIRVYSNDVNVAEAEALHFGLQLAREAGFSPLMFVDARFWFFARPRPGSLLN